MSRIPEEMMDAYLDWRNDNSRVELASKVKPLSNKVLLEMFYYHVEVDEKESNLILSGKHELTDAMGRPLRANLDELDLKSKESRLFPVAKILAVGKLTENYKDIVPGDIVYVADNLTGSKPNPAYDMWVRKGQEDRKYVKENPAPPRMLPNISTLWAQYIYLVDKFADGYTSRDAYTFLVPEGNILTKEYDN